MRVTAAGSKQAVRDYQGAAHRERLGLQLGEVMKFNRDGTRYQLETVIEAIEARCAKSKYPNLSDLLGADWGFSKDSAYMTPQGYRLIAIERAREQYS